MKTISIYFASSLVLFLCTAAAHAQNDLLPLLMGEKMNSAERSNPALAAMGGAYIALPLAGNIGLTAQTNAPFNTIFTRRDDDSLIFDGRSFLQNTSVSPLGAVSASLDIAAVRFTALGLQWSAGVSDRLIGEANIPLPLLRLVIEGNAPASNRSFAFDAEGSDRALRLMHFREWYAGASFSLGKTLSVGGRIKFLNGFALVDAQRLNLQFATDSLTYALHLRSTHDVFLNTPSTVSTLPFSFGNAGMAVDVGAVLQIGDKLRLQGSILDLGGINWASDRTRRYSAEAADFTFEGVTLEGWGSGISSDIGSDLLDSLEATFGDFTKESVMTALPPRILLAGEYSLDESSAVGAALQLLPSQAVGALSLTYRTTFFSFLNLMGGTTINARGLFLSGGMLVDTPIIQIHALVDNIAGIFSPQDSRFFAVRAGISFPLSSSETKEP